jgi:hypothetical protein
MIGLFGSKSLYCFVLIVNPFILSMFFIGLKGTYIGKGKKYQYGPRGGLQKVFTDSCFQNEDSDEELLDVHDYHTANLGEPRSASERFRMNPSLGRFSQLATTSYMTQLQKTLA